MTDTYFAARGSLLTDGDASKIGPELSRLAAEGRSTSADIVAEAKRKRSPLHPYVIDCSVEEAAERHYLKRAEYVARSIMIEVVTPAGKRTMRAFHSIRIEHEEADEAPKQRLQSYLTVAMVRERPDYSAQVIERARRELEQWSDRYAVYAEHFGSVFSAINAVLDEEQKKAA